MAWREALERLREKERVELKEKCVKELENRNRIRGRI
jgi:hypothetical protein